MLFRFTHGVNVAAYFCLVNKLGTTWEQQTFKMVRKNNGGQFDTIATCPSPQPDDEIREAKDACLRGLN